MRRGRRYAAWKSLESAGHELFTVVSGYLVGYAKATYDVLPDEALYCGRSNGGEGLGLDPLCEVVHGYHDELQVALGPGEWANDVDPPPGERPCRDDGLQLYVWGVLSLGLELAAHAGSNEVLGVMRHCRPVEALS